MSEEKNETTVLEAPAAQPSNTSKISAKARPKKADEAKGDKSSGYRAISGRVVRITVVSSVNGIPAISVDLASKKGGHSIVVDPVGPASAMMLALANAAFASGAKLHVKVAEMEGGALAAIQMELRSKR